MNELLFADNFRIGQEVKLKDEDQVYVYRGYETGNTRRCDCTRKGEDHQVWLDRTALIPVNALDRRRERLRILDRKAHDIQIKELAEDLYEGTPKLRNLAEELARSHGSAEALSFYVLMGPDIQNFWQLIALQLTEHSKEWRPNQGSGCILSPEESSRLKDLPRVEHLKPGELSTLIFPNVTLSQIELSFGHTSRITLEFLRDEDMVLVHRFFKRFLERIPAPKGEPG